MIPKISKATRNTFPPEPIQKFWLIIPEFKTRIDYFNYQPGMENTGQEQYLFSFARLKGSVLMYERYIWKCSGLWIMEGTKTHLYFMMQSWIFESILTISFSSNCQWFISLILYFEANSAHFPTTTFIAHFSKDMYFSKYSSI